MFGVFFFVSLYMQNVLGFSAVQAGAAFLPMTILIILVAPWAGRLSDRWGSRGLMTAGMLLVSGQLLYFSRLDADATFWTLLPGAPARRRRHGDDHDAERGRRDARPSRSPSRASARRC